VTLAPFTFPGWVPREWREAFSPSLMHHWPPPPDPTLPLYWNAGLVSRKLHYVGAIRSRVRRGTERSRRLLSLAGVRLVPMRGWKRYVTSCPACGANTTTLIAFAPGEPPFCLACRPRQLETLLSLLTALNAERRLTPLPPPAALLERTHSQLPGTQQLTATVLLTLPILAAATTPPPPERHPSLLNWWPTHSALGWRRPRNAHRNIGFSSALVAAARSLHPVHVLAGCLSAPGLSVWPSGLRAA